jgi:glycerol-3-phosphate acyltransferase PlsX
LKAAEGTAKQLATYLKLCLSRTLLSRLGALLAAGAFRALKDRMDPRKHNGGVFLGLNGIVVKSHGGTDALGFATAIDVAVEIVRTGLVEKIKADVEIMTGLLRQSDADS